MWVLKKTQLRFGNRFLDNDMYYGVPLRMSLMPFSLTLDIPLPFCGREIVLGTGRCYLGDVQERPLAVGGKTPIVLMEGETFPIDRETVWFQFERCIMEHCFAGHLTLITGEMEGGNDPEHRTNCQHSEDDPLDFMLAEQSAE